MGEVVVNARRSDQDAESVQDPRSVNPSALWQVVMEQSLGFLRCAALFYHYLSGVTYPPELTSLLPPDQEFISLAKYLALPYSPKHLLDSPFTLRLARTWSSHPNVELRPSKMDFTTTIPKLISLPADYSELINNISNFSCPRSMGRRVGRPVCAWCVARWSVASPSAVRPSLTVTTWGPALHIHTNVEQALGCS